MDFHWGFTIFRDDLISLNAHLGIAGFGVYTLRITSSNIIINAQAIPRLEISAMSSVVEYPGGSIIGSITSPVAINSIGEVAKLG